MAKKKVVSKNPEIFEHQPAILIHSATQLVTMRGDDVPRRGNALRDIGIVKNGALLISGGRIVLVGTTRDVLRDPWVAQHRHKLIELDCAGKVAIPGFVDSHTHPVFVAPRLVDFEKRTSGATYSEIAEAGGGIRSSIADVRSASEKKLTELVLDAFREMAAQGTTTIEAKSGYGLSVESEIKSLKVIRAASKRFLGTVISTLLAAHVPPPEYSDHSDDYIQLICDKMIPLVTRQKLAEYVDVFCDQGAFTATQSEKVFSYSQRAGLGVRAHVGQLTKAPLAPFLGYCPASLDHVDHLSDTDIDQLAKVNTIATLVPGANYFLHTDAYPPARKLIDRGVAVALATDYNPGSSPISSIPFVMSLACTQMQMTPEEALTAATINGAHALGLKDRKGSLEIGKDADIAFFEVEDFREIAYWIASNRCFATMMRGVFFE